MPAIVRSDIIAEEVKNVGRGRDEDPITLQVSSFFLFLIVRDFIIYDFLSFDDHYRYYYYYNKKLLAF
jgi:hypothetical protein